MLFLLPLFTFHLQNHFIVEKKKKKTGSQKFGKCVTKKNVEILVNLNKHTKPANLTGKTREQKHPQNTKEFTEETGAVEGNIKIRRHGPAYQQNPKQVPKFTICTQEMRSSKRKVGIYVGF